MLQVNSIPMFPIQNSIQCSNSLLEKNEGDLFLVVYLFWNTFFILFIFPYIPLQFRNSKQFSEYTSENKCWKSIFTLEFCTALPLKFQKNTLFIAFLKKGYFFIPYKFLCSNGKKKHLQLFFLFISTLFLFFEWKHELFGLYLETFLSVALAWSITPRNQSWRNCK